MINNRNFNFNLPKSAGIERAARGHTSCCVCEEFLRTPLTLRVSDRRARIKSSGCGAALMPLKSLIWVWQSLSLSLYISMGLDV